MEFSPSDDEHAAVAEVRCSVPSEEGTSKVPDTPHHAASDSSITVSISFNLPSADGADVRTLAGLDPSDVLHRRLINAEPETSKRVSCGQEVPPDWNADWRMSPTIVPRS